MARHGVWRRENLHGQWEGETLHWAFIQIKLGMAQALISDGYTLGEGREAHNSGRHTLPCGASHVQGNPNTTIDHPFLMPSPPMTAFGRIHWYRQSTPTGSPSHRAPAQRTPRVRNGPLDTKVSSLLSYVVLMIGARLVPSVVTRGGMSVPVPVYLRYNAGVKCNGPDLPVQLLSRSLKYLLWSLYMARTLIQTMLDLMCPRAASTNPP